jgi:glucose/arabinose dehydrogenase
MRNAIVTCTLALAGAAGIWAQQQARSNPCDPGNGGLTLPMGFCAAVVADNLGAARHMVVSPRGDLYVILENEGQGKAAGSIVALRDGNGDGKFEQQQRFGPGLGGTGIQWRDTYLYAGADTRIVRFNMANNVLVPAGPPETIVEFPSQRGHTAKPFAFGRNNELFVHVGAPSNACQDPDRRPGAPGQNPCPLLSEYGGIWKYDANKLGQKHTAAARYATGMRHTTSLMAHPVTGTLFQVQHGRDQLDTLWPKFFTAQQNGDLPAEEMHVVREGANWGWPYCYFDTSQNKRLQNPEYGGDGKKEGDCAKFDKPIAWFPAHNAPLDLLFYTGTQFPPDYRGGAFVAFHGSWNRAPLPMDGYNVRFLPFKGDSPAGPHRVFASGFTGKSQIMAPNEAAHRPAGLAQARDGSIYVSDDVKGRIWKMTYTGNRAETDK